MLLEFSVGNFLSFKAKTTLSLAATSIKEHIDTNIFSTERRDLLKGAVIYGANASGKSNFVRAMSTMRRLVLQSFDQSSADELDVTPFLLSTETEKAPSLFEAIFIIDNVRYRYGFEVDDRQVHAEWLFEAPKNAEKAMFLREYDGIEVTRNFPEGKDLEERTRDNALFLAVADQFNGKIAKKIMKWFDNFITISGLTHEGYKGVTFGMLEDKHTSSKLLNFYKRLDLGFDDIAINKKPFDAKELPNDMPESLVRQLVTDLEGAYKIDIKTIHKKYNDQGKAVGDVEFDMRSQESSGTNKIFNISGPVFDVLNDGGILVVDELDASLHPLLTLAVTRLFNSKQFNPNNAQLIFATHDTNLLYYGNYRRDQIYFVEKDQYGASDMYSLVEYKEEGKTIRKDRSFEKDYIEGRYGAIPFIGNLSNVVTGWQEK
ncbi:ATP-binding protein [Flagellimonas halotolerans]|uniref:ATP-binding protein n=1 Tax=Flagellimonas halotolerans TaxID=3112164 RepID=A0ABU6IRP1_9FLAO|nr:MULTISPECIES: ATP-binding protein [unclassified Allomuricauda]MEC3965805.1 ATP-binding protein [Muricauda sp. SYSU M86414]MEC4265729.1 ATP-binding protein [Muricauda sp. SYSU M84420]